MKKLVISLLSLGLGGCVIASEKPDFDTRLIVTSTPTAPSMTATPPLPLAPPQPCSDLSSTPTTSERNSCIFRVKSRIDDSYLNYRLLIAKQVGLTEEGLDVGSVTSSAAATATTGVAAKVFSGLATSLTGARTAFNNDALYQQSLQAVFKQMEADRLSVWANIQISMQTDTYTMSQAENDLLAYFRAGTVEDAVNSLDASAGTAQTTCKAASDAVASAGASKLKVQPPAPSTMAQPAATTTTERCSQIVTSADKTLALAQPKSPDVFSEESLISKNIKAIGTGEKTKLDAVANALGAPVSADYHTERASVLMALRAIDDPAKLAEAASRIQTALGEGSDK